MPQALHVDERTCKLVLGSFDAEFNNLWRFHAVSGGVVIELRNPSAGVKSKMMPQMSHLYINTRLSLTTERNEAAVFELADYAPFRAGPADVALQLFCDGHVLGSDEKSGVVFLQDPHVAENAHLNGTSNVLNVAWEATPDTDEAVGGEIADVPEWLQDMLLA
jgi:hypothetical protein